MDVKKVNRVKLNLGGTRFETTLATLTRLGPNFFSQLVDGSIPVIEDKDGYIFVDRNPVTFAVLLEYMRSGVLSIPPTLSLKSVVNDAMFFSLDLSSAFISDLEEGVYTSMNGHSCEILFLERNKDQPWIFGVTGVIKLTRPKRCHEFWKEVFSVREGVLVKDDFQISLCEGGLYFSQANVYSSERRFSLLAKKDINPTAINLKNDKWWTGNKFISGQPLELSFCHLEAGKWVISLRSGEILLGPFDAHFMCPNFFFVGTEDEQFWVLRTDANRLLTYNPFLKKTPEGYSRYEGWMRFTCLQ